MEPFLLSVNNISVRMGGKDVLDSISFKMAATEQWAIVGPSGSGKTVLAETLAGKHFYRGSLETSFGSPETFQQLIYLIPQQHRFRNLQNRSDFYYQQRYHSADSEQTITVRQALAPYWPANGALPSGYEVHELLDLLRLQPLLDENLIQLSNGENKRLQIMQSLMQEHELLILDQPFIGLDTKGREMLEDILYGLKKRKLPFLLISSDEDLPASISHVAILNEGKLTWSGPVAEAFRDRKENADARDLQKWKTLFNAGEAEFDYAVQMKHVSVRYADRLILDNINWTVARGECWSLSGPNGAGKSTLLSLISADNPQAYANEIYLFDKRRGSGESIWDIKKKIGYMSPELHLYFDSSSTVFQTVASGLFDSIGLFRRLSEEQELLISRWLEHMDLASKANRLISGLSAGEQRWVLLARALIKNPPLLILDEPCQGLDSSQSALFREMVNLSTQVTKASLIYVSHYDKDIPACVSKQIRLEKGKRIA